MQGYVDLIAVIISGVAAILAWIAKIRWSKEYADAKDQTIRAKDEQLRVLQLQLQELKDLNPEQLRTWYISI